MLRKHDPIAVEAMDRESPNYTICEELRRIYHLTDDEDIRYRCRVATSMAKSMMRKIEDDYGEGETAKLWKPRHRVKPIDVLFLTKYDWSNTGYKFWRMATEYLGLNCVMFKGDLLPWKPPAEAPLHPSLMSEPLYTSPTTVMAPHMESLINSAHVVHTFASTYPICKVDYNDVNLVVQHGGTVYRQLPEACNRIFNPIANKTIVQTPDLYGLGADNEELIYFGVDTDAIAPDFSMKRGKLVFGHFPSNPHVKGTDTILSVLKETHKGQFEWMALPDRVTWEQQLDLYKKCDVVIEAISPMQGDKPYGEWGNTALEAAASGCIVITHHTHPEIYREKYGKNALLVANTGNELKLHIDWLCAQSKDRIMELKKESREWAHTKHGLQATAQRLWDKVYRNFF